MLIKEFLAFFAIVGVFLAVCLGGSEVETIVLTARAFH